MAVIDNRTSPNGISKITSLYFKNRTLKIQIGLGSEGRLQLLTEHKFTFLRLPPALTTKQLPLNRQILSVRICKISMGASYYLQVNYTF